MWLNLGLSLIQWNFEGLSQVAMLWLGVMTASYSVYPCFYCWCNQRIKFPPKFIPTDDTDTGILGGEDALISEFPSTAFLFYNKFNNGSGYSCGATIISDRWVLTAAHCVKGAPASRVTLYAGSEYQFVGSKHQASRIIIHEDFILEEGQDGNLINVENDIAVVEVVEPFILNDDTIKAARLEIQDEDISPGIIVTTVGWGDIGENKTTRFLQKANMEIMDTEQCKSSYDPYTKTLSIDSRNVCLIDPREGKKVCKGGSGGPLFLDDVVVGIFSFASECRRFIRAPNVLTKVAYFRDWIMQKTGI